VGDDGFRALALAAAPWWAAESEIVETYFRSDDRTVATDLRWLRAQCGKELVDGVEVRLASLRSASLDEPEGRAAAIADARELLEEHEHLDAFARAYEAIGGSDGPPLTEASLRDAARWPENVALAERRALDRAAHPRLGLLAQAFTEGGCATLYAAGAELRGGTAADEAIAAACAAVYEDEVRHMRSGHGGIGSASLSGADWEQLTGLVIGQLRLRLPMRHAQFSCPVAAERLAELVERGAEPRAADLARVGVS
jgi:hypothetical protein